MSSVIVLDSSDEDEVPAKRAFLARSIPATITPIKGTADTLAAANVSANTLKHKKPKPRTIPSGITITRRSPVNVATTITNSSCINSSTAFTSVVTSGSGSLNTSISAAAPTTSNASLLLSPMGAPSTAVCKPVAPSLPKINAGFLSSNVKERHTPTPPRQQAQQPQKQQPSPSHQQRIQQGLPLLSQLPQLQPSPSVLRKRLTTSALPTQQLQAQTLLQQQQPPKLQQQQPPKLQQQQPPPKLQLPPQQPPKLQQPQQLSKLQQQQSLSKLQTQQQHPPKLQHQQQLQNEQQPCKLGTPPATNTTVSGATFSAASTSSASMLPLISSVQSMTAGATPPLQLLATPPHSAATTFNDQLLFSPKMLHTTCNLLPSTTVSPSRPQMSSSTHTSSSNSNNNGTANNNNNSNNINNNFKILLPPKRSNFNSGVLSANASISSAPSPPIAPTLATPVAQQLPGAVPRIAYVNSLAAQIPITNTSSSNASKPKPSPVTIVPVSITAASPTTVMTAGVATVKTTATSETAKSLASVRRIKPTTLLRNSDDAWMKRAPNTITTSFHDDDLVVELLPQPIKTKHQPHSEAINTTASKKISVLADAAYESIAKPQTPPSLATPSSIAPAVAPTNKLKSASTKPTNPLILDLTESPVKSNVSSVATATSHSATTLPSITMAHKSSEHITNGEAASQSPKNMASAINEKSKSTDERTPLSVDYEELLRVCREADSSADMEKLVKTKLIKYYYNVHPDFVHSKGFRKNLRTVVANIRLEPDLVYLHLKTIIDELKVRGKNKEAVPIAVSNSEEDNDNTGGAVGSKTGNKHTDEQIKKLNKALYILTKRIEVLESAEVDWDDEDSSYLQVERFKKRACQIYEKICDLTGESKNAHRLVKKPIHFNGTTYTHFNKTLQAYINRTKEFPDYFDVLRMLEHCNRQHDYALANFEMKRIAHDAFVKVGKLLQSRRKTDLYETVTHFTANEKDPATVDPMLQAKLSENQKKQTRISDVIQKYAREQDMLREELKEARQAKAAERLRSESNEDESDVDASTSSNAAKAGATQSNTHKQKNGRLVGSGGSGDENDDGEDDDDEDDDDDDDLEADVEKLANGDLSDVESDVEIVINRSTENIEKVSDKNCKIVDHKQVIQHKTLTDVIATGTAVKTADTVVTTTVPIITKSKDKSAPNTVKILFDKPNSTIKTTYVSAVASTSTVTTITATPTLTATSVNNNITRIKTVDPLANATPKSNAQTSIKSTSITTAVLKQPPSVPNGRMKGATDRSSSATTLPPTIKIVSVTSLKNKLCVEDDDANIKSGNPTKSQNTIVTEAQGTITKLTTATKDGKRQRTVAEIVISDEES